MATDKDRYDRQIKALLNGPSGEELDSQRRCEYRRKYPHADEDLIQLLMAADDKAGYPPVCIGHARYIMRTSAGNRRPAPTAKDFDDAARTVAREHYRIAKAQPHLKEPVSKKTYDPADKSPEAVAHRLYNSPESVENRVLLATLRKSAMEYKAAKAAKEPVSKKTHDLDNSPDEIETRAILSMFAHLRSEREEAEAARAAKLARTADLAYQIATSPLSLVLKEAPPMRTDPELAKQVYRGTLGQLQDLPTRRIPQGASEADGRGARPDGSGGKEGRSSSGQSGAREGNPGITYRAVRHNASPRLMWNFMRTDPELAKRFIAALSAENIEKHKRHEYHHGHPTLTEAELDLMAAAEKKLGHPVSNLAQAKQILGI